MRVSVVCFDSLLRESLMSLVGGIEEVELTRTDGSPRSSAFLARTGAIDAVLLLPGQLAREEVEHLSACRVSSKVKLLALAGDADDPARLLRYVDAVIRRSEGLEGLQRALSRLRANPTSKMPLLQMAPPLERPRRALKLTRRESDVVGLVAKGRSNRQIADSLGLREQSVKNLVSAIMRKLNCENRVQLALHFTAEPAKIAG